MEMQDRRRKVLLLSLALVSFYDIIMQYNKVLSLPGLSVNLRMASLRRIPRPVKWTCIAVKMGFSVFVHRSISPSPYRLLLDVRIGAHSGRSHSFGRMGIDFPVGPLGGIFRFRPGLAFELIIISIWKVLRLVPHGCLP